MLRQVEGEREKGKERGIAPLNNVAANANVAPKTRRAKIDAMASVAQVAKDARSTEQWKDVETRLAAFTPAERISVLLAVHETRIWGATQWRSLAAMGVYAFVNVIVQEIAKSLYPVGYIYVLLVLGFWLTVILAVFLFSRWRAARPRVEPRTDGFQTNLLFKWAFPDESSARFVALLTDSVLAPEVGATPSVSLPDLLRAASVLALFAPADGATSVPDGLNVHLRRALLSVSPDDVRADKTLRDALTLLLDVRARNPDRIDESLAASAILCLQAIPDAKTKSVRKRLARDPSERVQAALSEAKHAV